MANEAYENVREQVGACGIWCGSCAVGNGALQRLIEGLNQVLESHGAEHWAPEEVDYPAFAGGLAMLHGDASCPGCRKGGGREECELRTCASERRLSGCTACGDFGSCAYDELLSHMRKGAIDAGLFVAEPGDDPTGCIDPWEERLMKTWPGLLLFLEEA